MYNSVYIKLYVNTLTLTRNIVTSFEVLTCLFKVYRFFTRKHWSYKKLFNN